MAEVNCNNNVDTQLIGEPEIIMATDSNDRSRPMAVCLMVARKVQGQPCSKLMKVLLDSGGFKSMCHRNVIPRGTRITEASSWTLMNTLAGTYAPLGKVTVEGLRLPSFDKNRIIDNHDFSI